MRESFRQIKLLFSSAVSAIDNPPPPWQSLFVGGMMLVVSFLLLLSNSLSPNILSISIFPAPKLPPVELFLFTISTQIVCVGLPMLLVFGRKGIRTYIDNFALIQLSGLGLALVGFFYNEIFWNLYKLLPLRGLTANAVYEATLLLYPALILVLFRYILLWMISTKLNTSTVKMMMLVASHLVLSALVWIIGGLI